MSGQRDFVTSINVLQEIAPAAAQTGTLTGATIDTRDADAHTIIATLGGLGAGETCILTIEHSADSGMAGAAVAGAKDVLTGPATTNYTGGGTSVTIDGDDSELNGWIGYVGSLRYIRVLAALGAGTADIAAVCVQNSLHIEDHASPPVTT